MRWLVYIVAVLALASCARKVVEVQTYHDTITVERAVVHEVATHDTITITANQERDEVRVIYDTLERVREVVQTRWRDRIVTEAGKTETQVVHDTITVQSGATATQTTTTPKGGRYWWLGLVLAAVIFVGGMWVVRKYST